MIAKQGPQIHWGGRLVKRRNQVATVTFVASSTGVASV